MNEKRDRGRDQLRKQRQRQRRDETKEMDTKGCGWSMKSVDLLLWLWCIKEKNVGIFMECLVEPTKSNLSLAKSIPPAPTSTSTSNVLLFLNEGNAQNMTVIWWRTDEEVSDRKRNTNRILGFSSPPKSFTSIFYCMRATGLLITLLSAQKRK